MLYIFARNKKTKQQQLSISELVCAFSNIYREMPVSASPEVPQYAKPLRAGVDVNH